jgi:hypothetical protein
MGEQEGNASLYSDVCVSDLALISRSEQTHRNLRHLPRRLSGHRPRHLERWTGLHPPQETSLPLHRDQHLLSTFRRHRARRCRGSGRTWYRTIRNLCHQHLRAMTLDSSSHRFLQADLALKRQRNLFAVDTLMSSNNQLRRLLHFR